MKKCPKCGKNFNWWERATGENKEHTRNCRETENCKDKQSLAATCRGCPAGCFEETYNKKNDPDDE